MASMNETLLNAFQKRYTCKRYDPRGKVSEEDFSTILEVARLSPSSFGMEPWKLLVIEDASLRERILAYSWGAKKNADRMVVVLARKGVDVGSEYVEHIWSDVQGKSEQEQEELRPVFENLQRNELHVADSPRMLLAWARCQTYLLLGDMLCAAALLGIDSTPIEGYDAGQLNALFADEGIMDPDQFAVSVLVQFGKADPSHRAHPKTRRPAQEVIEYV